MVQALRRLTRAVWVLAALVALVLAVIGATGWVVARGFSNARAMPSDTVDGEAVVSQPAGARESYSYNGFHEWPTARKVAEASAIIVTAPQGIGKDARDVITEVIKHAPGMEFYYEVGDVYDPGFPRSDPAEMKGYAFQPSGQIVFFVGSPARVSYAVSYEAETGRCSSMGGISLEQLRELARQTPDVQRKG